jgi:SAM-dependent methyltransferase
MSLSPSSGAPGVTGAALADALPRLDVERFLADGFALKAQLAPFLQLEATQLEALLPQATAELAALHPGAVEQTFDPADAGRFYEDTVGTAHLLELAAWHLGSADYIADTLRLQERFARGQVLDFGGGIGSHALAAAALPQVEQVWFVDLNPHNRAFVAARAEALGLAAKLRCFRDLDDPALPQRFDTIVCLDALEHLSDPAGQLEAFAQRPSGPRRGPLELVFLQRLQRRISLPLRWGSAGEPLLHHLAAAFSRGVSPLPDHDPGLPVAGPGRVVLDPAQDSPRWRGLLAVPSHAPTRQSAQKPGLLGPGECWKLPGGRSG